MLNFALSPVFSLDADVWKKFLSRPALPFILRLLRGLATQHPPTQVLYISNEMIMILPLYGKIRITVSNPIFLPGADRDRFNNQLAQAGAGIQ